MNTRYTPLIGGANEGSYHEVCPECHSMAEILIRIRAGRLFDGYTIGSFNSHVHNDSVVAASDPLSTRGYSWAEPEEPYFTDTHIDTARLLRNEDGSVGETSNVTEEMVEIAEAAATTYLGGLMPGRDFFRLLVLAARRGAITTTGKEYKVLSPSVATYVRPFAALFNCKALPDSQGCMLPYWTRTGKARGTAHLMTPNTQYVATRDFMKKNRVDFHMYASGAMEESVKRDDLSKTVAAVQREVGEGRYEGALSDDGTGKKSTLVWQKRMTPPPTKELEDGKIVYSGVRRASSILKDVAPRHVDETRPSSFIKRTRVLDVKQMTLNAYGNIALGNSHRHIDLMVTEAGRPPESIHIEDAAKFMSSFGTMTVTTHVLDVRRNDFYLGEARRRSDLLSS